MIGGGMYRNQDLNTDSPLTSIMRSLSPAVIGKHQAQTAVPRTPQMPEMTDVVGLGELAKLLFGKRGGSEVVGPMSLLGGL